MKIIAISIVIPLAACGSGAMTSGAMVTATGVSFDGTGDTRGRHCTATLKNAASTPTVAEVRVRWFTAAGAELVGPPGWTRVELPAGGTVPLEATCPFSTAARAEVAIRAPAR